MEKQEFIKKCRQIREQLAIKSNKTHCSHLGSAYSIVDILVYLFNAKMNFDKDNYKSDSRDIFVLSKGHASLALYAVLHDLGIISDKEFEGYYQNGSYLIGHVNHKVPGVEFSTGSLGHGLPVAAGMALGYKLSKKQNRVFCLVGDGECDEGSIWETLRFIKLQNLTNITVMIDFNKLQGIPVSEKKHVLLEKMLPSVGLNMMTIDGHDFDDIKKAFDKKPQLILANTIKGKGVSFMENQLAWHYKSVSDEQLAQVLKEIRK